MWGFYENDEVFWRHFQWNGSLNKISEAFTKITRPFEDIFNGIETFLKWGGALSKNSRLFKIISR
jgi:hypothetical protein